MKTQKTHKVVRVGRIHQMVINKFKPGTVPGFTDVHEHVTVGTITSQPVTDTQRLRALQLRSQP